MLVFYGGPIFWSFLIFYHFLFFNALRRFRIAFLIGRFLILDPFLQPTVKIIKREFFEQF